MVLNIKLKAIDRQKEREVSSVQYSSNCQYHVPLIKDVKSQSALSVLEEIWSSLSKTAERDSELVLKFYKVQKQHTKTQLASVCLREFAETDSQAYRFTAVITTLRIITQNLMRHSTTTLRDVFYRDVSAFQGSQSRSNDTLELISKSLDLSIERDLRINASPKGLVFGGPQIRLISDEGTTIDLNYSKSHLVPASFSNAFTPQNENIGGIIVMEKEAVFKSFNEYMSESYIREKLIVLTGKGNPDKASTRFLSALTKSFLKIPIILFVDSDVYGLRILWTYVLAAGGPASNLVFAGTFLLEHCRGYLTIAPREWKLMMNFLKEISVFEKYHCSSSFKIVEVVKRELKRGMLLGKKAELNVMCDSSETGNLNSYLWDKVAHEICNKT